MPTAAGTSVAREAWAALPALKFRRGTPIALRNPPDRHQDTRHGHHLLHRQRPAAELADGGEHMVQVGEGFLEGADDGAESGNIGITDADATGCGSQGGEQRGANLA